MAIKDRDVRLLMKEIRFSFDTSCKHCKNNRNKILPEFLIQTEGLIKFFKGEMEVKPKPRKLMKDPLDDIFMENDDAFCVEGEK